MAVPARRHEAQQSKPAEQSTGPIHYSASIASARGARAVRRIGVAMSRHFAADIKDSGSGPFSAGEVIDEALSLGLHFLGIQYLGDPDVFPVDECPVEVEAFDTNPRSRRKP